MFLKIVMYGRYPIFNNEKIALLANRQVIQGRPMMSTLDENRWLVYVPHNSKRNLEIAQSKHVWGFSESSRRHVTFQRIKRGDLLILGSSYHTSTAENLGLGGRRKLEDFLGAFDEVLGFSVHRGYYFGKERLWPDHVYPHRVNLGRKLFSITHLVVDYLGNDLRTYLHRSLYQSPIEITESALAELLKHK